MVADLPENPILVALDLDTAEEAVRIARRVSPHVGGFKVGLQLLLGPGPAAVAAVAGLGKPVFADAKLHDIPVIVALAARRLGLLGVRWITAHGSGGRAMLAAATEGLTDGAGGRRAGVLAVTVLTNLTEGDLAETGVATSPGKLTSRISRLAAETGCEGVVCSARELGVVQEVAPGLLRVTPGIRPADTSLDDQARVGTPGEALRRGANLLVVGRPITGSKNPEAAAARLAEQLRGQPGRRGT